MRSPLASWLVGVDGKVGGLGDGVLKHGFVVVRFRAFWVVVVMVITLGKRKDVKRGTRGVCCLDPK